MTTASLGLRRNQNLTRTATIVQAGPVTSTVLLIGLVIVLSLLYLNQVTKTSTFNYRVSQLSNTKSELIQQQQRLEVEAARLQSVNELKSRTAANLSPAGNYQYTK
jgi:hypothetical protein